jgi:hypothetical protein
VRLTLSRHQRSNCFALRDFLFDHLVGAHEKSSREREAERSRGLDVDRQFNLRGLLHREIGGLLAPQDAAYIGAGQTIPIGNVRSIAQLQESKQQLRTPSHPAQRGFSLDALSPHCNVDEFRRFTRR